MKINLLVLNYNGKDLLASCLPSLIAAARKSSHLCSVTVVDNASTDGSIGYVVEHFPEVQVAALKENKVLCAYNEVVKTLSDDIVILLNNDIKAEEGFIDPLVNAIGNEKNVFLAAPKMLNKDSLAEGANTKGRIRWGLFWASARYRGFQDNVELRGVTFSSGMAAFDRQKFIELGGYDELYLPGTLEDSDIGFRAWKRGWFCIYEPASVIYHMGQVSFHRRFGPGKTAMINFRNVFLFIWKNISDPGIWCEHIVLLPLRLLYALCTGQTAFVSGFFQAVPLFLKARKKHRLAKDGAKKTDREVFALFK
jgi:GT2 family glycosyltransferase